MPVDRYLSDLEWRALLQSGRIRDHLSKLQADLEAARIERDVLLAENSRLKSELQLHRARPPVVSRKIGHLATEADTSPRPIVEPEPPKVEEELDPSSERFRLLELD